MDKNEILSVLIDGVKCKFSNGLPADEIRNALIELNGGSNKINPKTFYRGNKLFELVEELLTTVINDGIVEEGNPLFDLVDYRNVADGDEAAFHVEGDAHFVVASAAAGLQGVRRQRIVGGDVVPVKTEMYVVRVYESLGRLLAGRITFDQFINGVAKAFKQFVADMAYKAINAMDANTYGLDATYVATGSYSEDTLLAMIEHVEAATGKPAKIVGTRTALRKITTAVVADSAKEDMYNIGYFGKFNGTPMYRMAQSHEAGTNTFALNDNKIWVLASDDKPIKLVNEGEGLLYERSATDNNDLTQEYVYGQGLGVGVVCAAKMGVYNVG